MVHLLTVSARLVIRPSRQLGPQRFGLLTRSVLCNSVAVDEPRGQGPESGAHDEQDEDELVVSFRPLQHPGKTWSDDLRKGAARMPREPILSPLPIPLLCGGIAGRYEVHSLGFSQPGARSNDVPECRSAELDIIDTWRITIETLPERIAGRLASSSLSRRGTTIPRLKPADSWLPKRPQAALGYDRPLTTGLSGCCSRVPLTQKRSTAATTQATRLQGRIHLPTPGTSVRPRHGLVCLAQVFPSELRGRVA